MNDNIYIMWLSRVKGINSKKLDRLIEYFGTAKEVYSASRSELSEAASADDSDSIFRASHDGSMDMYVTALHKTGAKYISKYDEIFPKSLKYIDDIPTGVYYKGMLPNENYRLVSIVGSRRCSEYGRRVSIKLASDLAKRDVGIVSGLADGVDSFSHMGALRESGYTVAVLGTSIDKCYPAENIKLYERIVENNGCVMSEYAPYEKTYGADFVRRNRIIAGLSEILVVVEAEIKSGTSSTVSAALDYGKGIFAVPGSVFSAYSEGTNRMIRDGCMLALSYKDILREMNIEEKKTENKKSADIEGIDKEGIKIIEALNDGEADFDTLAAKTGIQASKLRTELTMLEIRKIVSKRPGQKYIIL
ncbi:DNA processing protein DprA [Clostridiales bacterium]|nr:DNA processing protein DprA [Clostridiales bacterium]